MFTSYESARPTSCACAATVPFLSFYCTQHLDKGKKHLRNVFMAAHGGIDNASQAVSVTEDADFKGWLHATKLICRSWSRLFHLRNKQTRSAIVQSKLTKPRRPRRSLFSDTLRTITRFVVPSHRGLGRTYCDIGLHRIDNDLDTLSFDAVVGSKVAVGSKSRDSSTEGTTASE